MIMEKRKPHYPLDKVKFLVRHDQWHLTDMAKNTAFSDFEILREEIGVLLQNLDIGDFYKSMTSYHDHESWHDVYHPWYQSCPVYLKLGILANKVKIYSLKRR